MAGLNTGWAHVKGKNNISLGVCLIGKDYFTKNSLDHLTVLKNGKNTTLMLK